MFKCLKLPVFVFAISLAHSPGLQGAKAPATKCVHEVMASAVPKDFRGIWEDYAFFESHSTEFENALQAHREFVAEHFKQRSGEQLNLLDFGCGQGTFLAALLKDHPVFKTPTQVTLVDRDSGAVSGAAKKIAQLAEAGGFLLAPPITGRIYFSQATPLDAHLIIAKHVLHYVADLKETVELLVAKCATGGLILFTLASSDNGLNQLNAAAMALRPDLKSLPKIPTLETLSRFLPGRITRSVRQVKSEIRFEDTPANRQKIHRFNLGDHYSRFTEAELKPLMDPYRVGSEIIIPLIDEILVLQK